MQQIQIQPANVQNSRPNAPNLGLDPDVDSDLDIDIEPPVEEPVNNRMLSSAPDVDIPASRAPADVPKIPFHPAASK